MGNSQIVLEEPEAFRPKINCPETDVFFVFLGSYGGGKMGNALGLGQIGILVRFLRDFYVIFFVNLT